MRAMRPFPSASAGIRSSSEAHGRASAFAPAAYGRPTTRDYPPFTPPLRHRGGSTARGKRDDDNVFTAGTVKPARRSAGDRDRRARRSRGRLSVVYAPEGKGFRLEPVTHMTDALIRRPRRTARACDTAPRRAFSCTMQIGVRLLP
jgi:hypothetical protein